MADLTSAHALLAHLRRQPLDLRLEVILADLLEDGYSFDDFLVRPVGLFARRYRRDLGAVREERFERAHRPVVRLVLETHREGLYDMLPQQVFHQPGTATTDVRSTVEDIRHQRRKEQATRLFFLPFEQEFFRCRVRIEQEERRYFTSQAARWHNEVLAQFWGIAEMGIPAGPLTNLLYLLPLAHGLVGDLPRTQRCFESVLGHAIRLRVVAPLRYALPTSPRASLAQQGSVTLGNLVLGCDLILRGHYQEILPALEITLQGLTVSELEAYLREEWPAKALALLCEYFVAFETDITVSYEIASAEPAFWLGEGEQAAVLGFTSAGI